MRATEKERLLQELRQDMARKGGHARKANLTPEQLSRIGRKGAKVRWAKERAAAGTAA